MDVLVYFVSYSYSGDCRANSAGRRESRGAYEWRNPDGVTDFQTRTKILYALQSVPRVLPRIWMGDYHRVASLACEDLTMTPTPCVGQRVSACFRSPG